MGDKEEEKKKKTPMAPAKSGKRRKKKGPAASVKIPVIFPTSKCKLRLLKLERVKDFLLMEQEFIQNQEIRRPREEQNEVSIKTNCCCDWADSVSIAKHKYVVTFVVFGFLFLFFRNNPSLFEDTNNHSYLSSIYLWTDEVLLILFFMYFYHHILSPHITLHHRRNEPK